MIRSPLFLKVLVVFFIAALAVPVAVVRADDNTSPVPLMRSCEPAQGRTGDVVAVTGENLGKARIAEVFLTRANEDVRVEVVAQTDKVLKFKVPSEAAVGRYSLMVLTTTSIPQLIEQPVIFNVTN
ncbi:MAG: hypothetical protein R2729_12610 [Bryobacteraceae bacterium]